MHWLPPHLQKEGADDELLTHARVAIAKDRRVLETRHKLVPKRMGELEFWRRYLATCMLIKKEIIDELFDVAFVLSNTLDESSFKTAADAWTAELRHHHLAPMSDDSGESHPGDAPLS